MELILYYIKESGSILLSFLILIFILGIFAYLAMRNFRQDKKFKVVFYGLFLRMKNIDILKLSTVVVRAFLVCYATMVTEQTKIWMCLTMVAIAAIVYVVCAPKRIVYEIICTLMQMILVYFIYIVNNYMTEIEYSPVMLAIKMFLIIFVLILTTYLFFRDVDIVAEDRVEKNLKAEK